MGGWGRIVEIDAWIEYTPPTIRPQCSQTRSSICYTSMPATILAPTRDNIAFLGERLRAGELVAMPTETVYGLAASVWDEAALAKVFAVKERPRFDPLICHVAPDATTDWLGYLVELGLIAESVLTDNHFKAARTLAEQFWPGPLTLVLPKTARVTDLATSGLETLAIRVPQHPSAQALIRAAGVPLCAPSANRFGRISPTSAEDVYEELGDRIDWILDGGRCEIGLESTVVGFDDHGPRILRRGGVSQEAIGAVLGHEVPYAPLTELGSGQLASPGMLASHYAPRKKLLLLPEPIETIAEARLREAVQAFPAEARIGVLLISGKEAARQQQLAKLQSCFVSGQQIADEACLSQANHDLEAAQNLFRMLRQLDCNEQTTHLLASPPDSQQGLRSAILDRLQRASHTPPAQNDDILSNLH